MSHIRKGILGALAICLVSGAMQFAFGHDLIGGEKVSTAAPETGVNRAAKSDRAALVPVTVKTETVALKLDSLAETSVVIRVPVTREEARSRPAGTVGDHARSAPEQDHARLRAGRQRADRGCKTAAARALRDLTRQRLFRDFCGIARSDSDDAIHVSACGAMDCFAWLAMTMWKRYVRQNNPTGKSAKSCPALCTKIFRLTRRANQRYDSARLTR